MYIYESLIEHGKYTVVNDVGSDEDDIKWNVYFTKLGGDPVPLGKFERLSDARGFVADRLRQAGA